MEQIVKPALKLKGTVTVPGELEPSVLSVVLICRDRVGVAPPSARRAQP